MALEQVDCFFLSFRSGATKIDHQSPDANGERISSWDQIMKQPDRINQAQSFWNHSSKMVVRLSVYAHRDKFHTSRTDIAYILTYWLSLWSVAFTVMLHVKISTVLNEKVPSNNCDRTDKYMDAIAVEAFQPALIVHLGLKIGNTLATGFSKNVKKLKISTCYCTPRRLHKLSYAQNDLWSLCPLGSATKASLCPTLKIQINIALQKLCYAIQERISSLLYRNQFKPQQQP